MVKKQYQKPSKSQRHVKSELDFSRVSRGPDFTQHRVEAGVRFQDKLNRSGNSADRKSRTGRPTNPADPVDQLGQMRHRIVPSDNYECQVGEGELVSDRHDEILDLQSSEESKVIQSAIIPTPVNARTDTPTLGHVKSSQKDVRPSRPRPGEQINDKNTSVSVSRLQVPQVDRNYEDYSRSTNQGQTRSHQDWKRRLILSKREVDKIISHNPSQPSVTSPIQPPIDEPKIGETSSLVSPVQLSYQPKGRRRMSPRRKRPKWIVEDISHSQSSERMERVGGKEAKMSPKSLSTLSSIQLIEELSSDYLDQGADDNVAVEASSKLLTHHSRLSSFLRKRRRTTPKQNVKSLGETRQSALRFGQKFSFRERHETKVKKIGYHKQLYRKSLIKKGMVGVKERVLKQLKERVSIVVKAMAQVIRQRSKAIIALLGLLGFLIVSVTSSSNLFLNGFSSIGYEIASSSYLSSEEMLLAINHVYSTKELNLSNYLDRLQENRPGYDAYVVNGKEKIKHDPHLLFAYLTARFGEIKQLSQVEGALESLFQSVYSVDYETKEETRYKVVVEKEKDETGQEKDVVKRVPYTHRTLIATVNKKDEDGIIQAILTPYSNSLTHYGILKSTKGNMAGSFPSGGTSLGPSGVSSVYDIDLSGGNFPPPNPNHVAGLNGGYPGQCTWYVYNRFSQLGKPIKHSPMGNGGEWAFYASRYGYPVSREARAGTAICMPPGVGYSHPTYGHIAFVEKVNSDGSLVISEMNAKGEFVISTGYVSRETAAQCYFINFGL